MADFWYDLGVNLLAGLIGFFLATIATYLIVGHLLDKKLQEQRLKQAKPIAKTAIDYQLWPILRIVVLDLTQMTISPTQILSRSDVFFVRVQENTYKFIYDQIQNLINTYPGRISDDILKDLMEFGFNAGFLCDSIAHIKVNWQIKSHLDEWKNLKSDADRLAGGADSLVRKLSNNGLLSEDLAKRYELLRREALSRGIGYTIPYGGKRQRRKEKNKKTR